MPERRTIVVVLMAGIALMILISLINRIFRKGISSADSPPVVLNRPVPPPVAEAPWAHEPVVEPVLAGTLLQGATVEYYQINGNAPEQLEASLAAMGPGSVGVEAKTTYQLVLHKGNLSDGSCGFSNATVAADITALMPRWVPMPNATDPAKQWWSYRIKELAGRQQAHINTAHQEAQQATSEMRQANCNTGDETYAGINNRLKQAHVPALFPAAGSDVQFHVPVPIPKPPPRTSVPEINSSTENKGPVTD